MTEKSSTDFQRCASNDSIDSESCEVKSKEGGCAAWLTVLGSVLVYYASFGVMNSFGFFQNYYTTDFLKTTPTSTIAFIGTLQMALMNSLAAMSGTLCDQYGVKYLYIASGTGTIVALIILSFIQPEQFWYVFFTQGLLMGLTIAFGVQPALTVVGQHFKEKRALAMGLVCTGSSMGGIGFPLMFEHLVPTIGFSNALRVTAVKIGICYSIALFISTSIPSGGHGRRTCSTLIDFRGFLDSRYSVLCVALWFTILGLWIPSYYIKSYATVAYPNNRISDYLLCIINGCNIFGAIFAGIMGDRIGRLNLLWPMALICSFLCLLLWPLNTSLGTLIVFACLYGFSTSSVIVLPPVIIGQITPDGKLGARIGAFYSIVAIASLVGTPIGGALITDSKDRDGYRWLIFFSGATIFIGSILMLGTRMIHDKAIFQKQ